MGKWRNGIIPPEGVKYQLRGGAFELLGSGKLKGRSLWASGRDLQIPELNTRGAVRTKGRGFWTKRDREMLPKT